MFGSDEVSRMRQAAGQMIADVRGNRAAFRQSYLSYWRSRIGNHLDTILASRERALEQLSSCDSEIRMAAISVFPFCHTSEDNEYVVNCKRMALEDPCTDVRCCALSAIGGAFANTAEIETCDLLLRMLDDRFVDQRVKDTAYGSLLEVIGVDPLEVAEEEVDGGGIDWKVVERVKHTINNRKGPGSV
jgi:hypothetical protein